MITIVEQEINGVAVNNIKLSINIWLNQPGDVKLQCVYYSSADNTRVKSDVLLIPEEIYNNWGTDDNYIINWASQQLGFTVI